MREWEAYSVKYIVPSRIITTTKGDREFSTMTACRAIASRQDLRNRNNEARKNAPSGKTSQSILVRRSSSLTSNQNAWNPLVQWYISLVRISNWITDQAISVDLSGGGIAGHPGHATPGGDGITARAVRAAMPKQA
jgi:hypothetical protein